MAEQILAVEYREVKGFPEYRVGNDGTVWSCRKPGGDGLPTGTWREIGFTGKKGYRRVVLVRDKQIHRRAVHHLVLEAFVGPCPNGMESCHFPDPTPSNNRIENLRWGTKKDNGNDRVVLGRQARGEMLPFHKVTSQQVEEMRNAFSRNEATTAELAKKYGIVQSQVCRLLRGKNWKSAPGPTKQKPLRRYLTSDEVSAIRSRRFENRKQLAREFGVKANTITYVLLGKRHSKELSHAS